MPITFGLLCVSPVIISDGVVSDKDERYDKIKTAFRERTGELCSSLQAYFHVRALLSSARASVLRVAFDNAVDASIDDIWYFMASLFVRRGPRRRLTLLY